MTPSDQDFAWIAQRVRARYTATVIYLFGSQAKGTARPDSDIDLLVVGPSRLPQHRRGREVAAALASFPVHIDVLYYTEEELAEERTKPVSFISSALAGARIL